MIGKLVFRFTCRIAHLDVVATGVYDFIIMQANFRVNEDGNDDDLCSSQQSKRYTQFGNQVNTSFSVEVERNGQ